MASDKKFLFSKVTLILYTIYTLEEDVPDDSLKTTDRRHSKMVQAAKADSIRPVIKQLASRISNLTPLRYVPKPTHRLATLIHALIQNERLKTRTMDNLHVNDKLLAIVVDD